MTLKRICEVNLAALTRERFLELKADDALLLFPHGDYHVALYDDAATVAGALGITLTSISPGVPAAAIPRHSEYWDLRTLEDAGFRMGSTKGRPLGDPVRY